MGPSNGRLPAIIKVSGSSRAFGMVLDAPDLKDAYCTEARDEADSLRRRAMDIGSRVQ